MTDFVTWLNNELSKRNMTQSEFGRRGGISHGTVSMLLSGRNAVSWDFCMATSRVFGMAPEEVFRIAGLLPPNPTPQKIQTLIDLANNLDETNLDILISFAKCRYQEINKKNR